MIKMVSMIVKPQWRVVRVAGCLLFLAFVVACILYITKGTPDPYSKPLTPDEERQVADVFASGLDPYDNVLKIHGRVFFQEDMDDLKPGGWLESEIVDAHMRLLEDRSVRNNASVSEDRKTRVKVLKTVFFTQLTKYKDFTKEYKTVQQWYKRNKVAVNDHIQEIKAVYCSDWPTIYKKSWGRQEISRDDLNHIFDRDRILIPIHPHRNHWSLMSLNMKKKTAEYYDSLGWRNGTAVWTYLKLFLQEEWIRKHGGNGIDYIDKWEFKEYTPGTEIPKQYNGFDCGVFVCKTAEYILDGRELT
eukprot:896625_1